MTSKAPSIVLTAAMATQAFCLPPLIGQALAAQPAAKPARAAAPKPKNIDLSSQYNAYLGRLRSKVAAAWNFPNGRNKVVLQVEVQPDGSAGSITLSSTPKSEEAEQAANAAFAQAQPLEALPANSPPVKVTMNFDSFADPHGESNSSLTARLDPVRQTPASPAQQ